jgi:hypothetical protein
MGMGTEVDGLELSRGCGGAEFQFNREGVGGWGDLLYSRVPNV